jgi:hypothetical protein
MARRFLSPLVSRLDLAVRVGGWLASEAKCALLKSRECFVSFACEKTLLTGSSLTLLQRTRRRYWAVALPSSLQQHRNLERGYVFESFQMVLRGLCWIKFRRNPWTLNRKSKHRMPGGRLLPGEWFAPTVWKVRRWKTARLRLLMSLKARLLLVKTNSHG